MLSDVTYCIRRLAVGDRAPLGEASGGAARRLPQFGNTCASEELVCLAIHRDGPTTQLPDLQLSEHGLNAPLMYH